MRFRGVDVAIKENIIKCIDEGMTDKQEIYTKVVEVVGCPRPSVRRVASKLKVEWQNQIDIFEKELAYAPNKQVRIEA